MPQVIKKVIYALAVLLLAVAIACQGEPGVDPQVKPQDKRYTAVTLEGKPFDAAAYEGDKILFAFFSIHHKNAPDMLRALTKILPYERQFRFRIFAVNINPDEQALVKAFIEKHKVALPVLVDSTDLALAGRLGIANEVALRGLSNKHEPSFGIKQYDVFALSDEGEEDFIAFLKENLEIKSYHGLAPVLGHTPEVPDIDFDTFDGKTLAFEDFKGKVVQVIFYSPACPHCQEEMTHLRDKVYPVLHPKGYEVIGFSMLKLEGKALSLNKSFKFPWPTVDDSERLVRKLFSPRGTSVPENFIIDKSGRVRFSYSGYNHEQEKIYAGMIKKLLGQVLDPKEILSDKRFNGEQSCLICHEGEHVQWQTTAHGHAWETLVIKGEQNNPECIGCHSLGMDDPRGYKAHKDKKSQKQVWMVPEFLQNVQCENCHGIGGPHKSEPMKTAAMEKTCLTCHTDTFSLHFDPKKRLPKVDHSDTAAVMKMSFEDRLALLTKVGKRPAELFDTTLKYVGSSSCMSCHAATHQNWQSSVHGQAFETLVKAGKQDDANCLKCHTVGFNEESGYQVGIAHKDLQGVGCESCHGPGETHVASKKKEDIRGLGDDCPFCVIEQICLSCHDAANSPNFNIHQGLKDLKGHGPPKEK